MHDCGFFLCKTDNRTGAYSMDHFRKENTEKRLVKIYIVEKTGKLLTVAK